MTALPHSSLRQERLESLKAGALSGAIAAGVTLGFGLLQALLRNLESSAQALNPIAAIVHLTIATASGALFGITYRYIVRQDSNPQLAAGAVGAFGLVRGLAQLEAGLGQQAGGALALMVGESVGLFAIAQAGLQLAMQRRWIQPFGAVPPPERP